MSPENTLLNSLKAFLFLIYPLFCSNFKFSVSFSIRINTRCTPIMIVASNTSEELNIKIGYLTTSTTTIPLCITFFLPDINDTTHSIVCYIVRCIIFHLTFFLDLYRSKSTFWYSSHNTTLPSRLHRFLLLST